MKKLLKKLQTIKLPPIEAVQAELAKKSLLHFMEYDGRGDWRRAKHLELYCKALEDVVDGKIKRLLVTMPPRHGKSEVGSKKFPAWVLMNNPSKEIILTSYSVDLANDFSRILRSTVKNHSPIFGNLNLIGSVERWGFEGFRGGFVSAGVGGPITGRGADIFIIDDPYKNYAEASSEKIRGNIINWYKSTARTRLSPGGAIILIMTRWHEDDLAAQLLGKDNNWTVINFPAIAETNDVLDRQPGEFLWTERFTQEEYLEFKKDLGEYFWSALYQQRPAPAQGIVFKRDWMRFWGNSHGIGIDCLLPDRFDEILQSWDCTFKDLKESDYVVGQVWGKSGGSYYLLDQIREQMDVASTMRSIEQLTNRWPTSYRKLIEDKANGSAVISLLRQRIPGLIPIEPEGGKIARAQACSAFFESGNVFTPAPNVKHWSDTYIDEICSFPYGAHDDQVDCTSQALISFAKRGQAFIA